MSMMLKPQDVLVLMKLVVMGDREWSYAGLARELHMSVSEVHVGLKRASHARLLDMNSKRPIVSAWKSFLFMGSSMRIRRIVEV